MQGGQGTRTGDAALRLSASRTLSSGGHHCRHVWGGLASLLSVLPTFKQSETQAGLGSREPPGPPLTWRSGKSGPSWPGKATSVPGRPSPPASRAYRELFHGRRHPHIFPFGPFWNWDGRSPFHRGKKVVQVQTRAQTQFRLSVSRSPSRHALPRGVN